MDPQETWFLICDALRRMEQAFTRGEDMREAREDAVSALLDLVEWLRHNGFPPTMEE